MAAHRKGVGRAIRSVGFRMPGKDTLVWYWYRATTIIRRLASITYALAIRAFALIGFAYVVIVLACGLRIFFPITMH